MVDSPPLASVAIHPLQPPRGPPAPYPDDEVTLVSGFAKLRGTPEQRQAAAAAASTPTSTTIHTPTYTFIMDSAATLVPVRAPAMPSSLDAGFPDGYTSRGAHAGVEEVILAAQAAGIDFRAPPLEASGDASPLIITYRNNLRKIFGTAYDPMAGWVVDAVDATATTSGRRPIVCLDIVQTPAFDATPESDQFSYWGYKFEALCTAAGGGGGGPPQPARHGRPEWAALVKRRLGGCDVLMAAETDGYCPELAAAATPGGGGNAAATQAIPHHAFVELKTLRWPTSHGAAVGLHRRKVPTWWVQSWLAGAAVVWAGGREHDGMLTRVDRIPVRDLPRWSASQGGRWCPRAIADSGGSILDWMAAAAAGHPGTHLRFEYVPPPVRGAQGVLSAREVVGGDLGARLKIINAPPRKAGGGGGGAGSRG